MGEYDRRNALITIRAYGSAPDTTDWADSLMRMYLKWAEGHVCPARVYDLTSAADVGITAVTFVVSAPFAYGVLAAEEGVHQMTGITRFAQDRAQCTPRADVSVLPLAEPADPISVSETDLKVEIFRGPGPGGQPVRPISPSAVRLTHLPTGIQALCQGWPTSRENRDGALVILRTRLLDRQRGAVHPAGITRDYTTHPMSRVKDLRSGHEDLDTAKVLDGFIGGFLAAGIRVRVQQARQELNPDQNKEEV